VYTSLAALGVAFFGVMPSDIGFWLGVHGPAVIRRDVPGDFLICFGDGCPISGYSGKIPY